MQKSTKQVLGFGGLAIVAAITTAAYNIPSVGAVSAGGEVNLEVTVYNDSVDSVINKPLDGSHTASNKIQVEHLYSHGKIVQYYLSYNGQTIELPGLNFDIDTDGTDTFYLDMTQYDYFGDYVLSTRVENFAGLVAEDSVMFKYDAATLDSARGDEDGNPIVEYTYNYDVKSIEFYAYDKDGNQVYGPFICNMTNPGSACTIDTSNQNYGKGTVKLNFIDAGIDSGAYKIIGIAYDDKNANGEVLVSGELELTSEASKGMRQNYNYLAPEIEIPNTGAFLESLNISREDFVVSGVIVFMLVTMIALAVIKKSSKKSSKR